MLEAGKDLGLMFYGTISVGGLGSSESEDRKTVDLVYELAARGWLDEVQVSVNTPQPGTDFYHSAQAQGLLRPVQSWNDYDGNGHVVVEYPHYPAERIQAMFRDALAAFDRGKEEACSSALRETLAESLADIPRGARVLVLRSVRPWMIALLLDTLHTTRGIRPDVLAQDAVIDTLQVNPHVNQVFSYGSGFFSTDGLPHQLRNQIREQRYDWILVPMANNHLSGYQNVLEVAESLGGAHILCVYNAGHARVLA